MIVCSCNVLTDCAIRACLARGADRPGTPAQVYRSLGCRAKCGQCATTIRSMMPRTGIGPSLAGSPIPLASLQAMPALAAA